MQGHIELMNTNSSEDIRLDFEGIHFVSNGSLYGFAEPNGYVSHSCSRLMHSVKLHVQGTYRHQIATGPRTESITERNSPRYRTSAYSKDHSLTQFDRCRDHRPGDSKWRRHPQIHLPIHIPSPAISCSYSSIIDAGSGRRNPAAHGTLDCPP